MGDNKSLQLRLHSCENPITLKAVDADKIEKAESLALIGSGFSSEEEANRHGFNLKQALLIVGAILRFGIDPGKEKTNFIVGKVVKEKARDMGYRLLEDTHGLCAYREDIPVLFASSKTSVVSGPKSKTFIDRLIEMYNKNYQLSEKQTLALELYNLSRFEWSQRAKFLTLIIIVEALSERENVSDKELKNINELIKFAKATGLNNHLVGRLRELKKESISKSCRKLVESHLGREEAKEFNKSYEIRSNILHKGKVPSGVNLSNAIPSLDQLVYNLLLTDILGKLDFEDVKGRLSGKKKTPQ